MTNKVGFARYLRKNQTIVEEKLWSKLRNKQIDGVKFRRQEQIGIYVVDFISFEKGVIIELDGGQHNQEEKKAKDKERDLFLKNQGYTILRFWDNDILENFEGVLNVITLTLTLSHQERESSE